jgi:hypothetical protein
MSNTKIQVNRSLKELIHTPGRPYRTLNRIFRLLSEKNMEQSKLDMIVGRRVVAVDLTPQDAGLQFEGGGTLNIYNRYSVFGLADGDAEVLVGAKITSVVENTYRVVFEFDSSVRVEVDLTDDAFTSPEAMQLRIPGKPILIWN